MLFTSIKFIVFYIFFLVIYFFLRKTRKFAILIASYVFCAFWSIRSLLFLVCITLITYISGIVLEKYNKKIIVYSTICLLVICLFWLKYSNFTIEIINGINSRLGNNHVFDGINVIAPLGISFYSLQAIGYLIDVHRKDIVAEKNIINYAVFISFFSIISSGPIERSGNLLKQIREKFTKPTYEEISNALVLILYGFFLKMVIADRLSILVDNVFSNYYMYYSFELIIGAVAYSIQLYCDFSSYSIIAMGTAQALGYKIIENFDTPYFSTSIKEFWRRWHISLSSWFRDYIYIPLGGSRCSKFRKYINLMITFLISGLWHGANWTFIIWGWLHGIYQIVGDYTTNLRKKVTKNIQKNCFSFKLGKIIITNIFVDLAWIVFRSDSLAMACKYITRMLTKIDPWNLFGNAIYSLGLDRTEINILIVSLIIVFIVDIVKYTKRLNIAQELHKQNLWFRWSVIFGLLFMIVIFGEYGAMFDAKSFVYFQF